MWPQRLKTTASELSRQSSNVDFLRIAFETSSSVSLSALSLLVNSYWGMPIYFSRPKVWSKSTFSDVYSIALRKSGGHQPANSQWLDHTFGCIYGMKSSSTWDIYMSECSDRCSHQFSCTAVLWVALICDVKKSEILHGPSQGPSSNVECQLYAYSPERSISMFVQPSAPFSNVEPELYCVASGPEPSLAQSWNGPTNHLKYRSLEYTETVWLSEILLLPPTQV